MHSRDEEWRRETEMLWREHPFVVYRQYSCKQEPIVISHRQAPWALGEEARASGVEAQEAQEAEVAEEEEQGEDGEKVKDPPPTY